jgi:hypothetical protein
MAAVVSREDHALGWFLCVLHMCSPSVWAVNMLLPGQGRQGMLPIGQEDSCFYFWSNIIMSKYVA